MRILAMDEGSNQTGDYQYFVLFVQHMRQVGEVIHAEVFTEYSGRSAGCGVVEYESVEAADLAIQTLNDSVLDGRNIFVREDREPGKQRGEGRFGGGGRDGGRRDMGGRGMGGRDMGGRDMGGRDMGGRDMGGRDMEGGGFGSNIAVTDRGYETRRGAHGRGSDKGRKIVVWNLPFHVRWQDLKDIFRNYGSVIRADVMLFPDGKSKGMGTVLFEAEEEAQRAIDEMTGKEIDGRVIDCRMDRYAT